MRATPRRTPAATRRRALAGAVLLALALAGCTRAGQPEEDPAATPTAADPDQAGAPGADGAGSGDGSVTIGDGSQVVALGGVDLAVATQRPLPADATAMAEVAEAVRRARTAAVTEGEDVAAAGAAAAAGSGWDLELWATTRITVGEVEAVRERETGAECVQAELAGVTISYDTAVDGAATLLPAAQRLPDARGSVAPLSCHERHAVEHDLVVARDVLLDAISCDEEACAAEGLVELADGALCADTSMADTATLLADPVAVVADLADQTLLLRDGWRDEACQ